MMTYEQISAVWEKHGVFDTMMDRYLKEIEEKYNWDAIAKEIENADVMEDCCEEDKFKCCYIGTVFSETPSGKYYMPWACSNVTPKEALLDEIWQEAMEEVLSQHGMFGMPGEGDPCDIFFCIPVID